RFNYHNQFLKAFPDHDTMVMAKRLWARLLCDYSGAVIMRAAERAVKESSWLPNVHEVLARCDVADTFGLPSAHAAYMEACRAPDWFFLANTPEQQAVPVFQRNHEILLQRLQNGENLELDIAPALPETVAVSLPRAEQRQRLQSLKKLL